MKKMMKWLQQIENFILVVSFSVMVIACFVQVVNRNFFKIPISGLEEIAKYSMVYMVLLGTELGLRDGTQISVTAVVDKLHGRAKKAILLVSRFIIIGFSAIMFNSGIQMVLKQHEVGQLSPGLGLPMTVPYFALVLSFGAITLTQIAFFVADIRNFNSVDEEKMQAVEGDVE